MNNLKNLVIAGLMLVVAFACEKDSLTTVSEDELFRTFALSEETYEKIYSEFEMFRIVITPDDIDVFGSQDKGANWTNLEELGGLLDYPTDILENTKDRLVVKTNSGLTRIITRSGNDILVDDILYVRVN